MIRITRLSDYAVVLLSHIARDGDAEVHRARDLAEAVRLPLPTVNKILKQLTRKNVLGSQRGVNGGYRLARPAAEISVLDILTATEGPLGITECTVDRDAANCEHEGSCPVDGAWHRIDRAIRDTLRNITLAEMARPGVSGPGVMHLKVGHGARTC